MADDDLDDYDLDDDDDMPSGESGVPSPTDYDGDDDDFDFDDDFDEGGSSGGGLKDKLTSLLSGDKKKLAMIGGGVVVALGLLGGGAFWLFSGDDSEVAQEDMRPKSGAGTSVGLALEQTATRGLTPQGTMGAAGGGKLSVGVGQKLSVGAAQGTGAGTMSGGTASYGGYDPNNAAQPLSAAAVAEIGVSVPAVLPQAVASLGQPKQAQPLALPNDPGMFESTSYGTLPRISPQGKEPWKTYARPFQMDATTPLMSLVVTGLGMSNSLTEAAINYLPANVTLSFSAYGTNLKAWVDKARAMGHEVLMELPMESASFPADDPGPLAMMTSKTPAQNLKVLNLMMSSAQGYVGFVGIQGSRFLKNKKAMGPVMGEIKERGLFFMDPGTAEGSVALEMADTMQMARAIANQQINVDDSSARIRTQLDLLATASGSQGAQVAMMRATPNAIKVISDWASESKSVQLAPITSMAGRQTN